MADPLLSSVRRTLDAIATAVIPESSALDDRAWAELHAVIDGALAGRDAHVRRQLATFLRLLQWLPIVRYGRPLTSLNTRQRRAFLESIERSPLLVVRRGFWGIRTLVFMGYYTRQDVAAAIGYRPSADGWEARGGTVSTVPLAPMLWVEP
jgi:hypothetical protein